MRIIFAGTPEIALASLESLAAEHEVVAVLTNPDRPKGRGRKMVASPVKEKALELGIAVLQPEKMDQEALAETAAFKADLLVSFAFGKIFKADFLNLFPKGAINVHPSRLPLYRGPSPLSAAIADGVEVTAITVQAMALKMDSGDILVQRDLPLDPRETTESLTEKAGRLSAPIVVEAVNAIASGSLKPIPQKEEEASYCSFVKKEDGLIDWNQDVLSTDRRIRACTPWPGAYTHWQEDILYIREAQPYQGDLAEPQGVPGRVLGVDKRAGILIETGKGILAAQRLQLQSRKNLDFQSFLNGNREFLSSQLGV